MNKESKNDNLSFRIREVMLRVLYQELGIHQDIFDEQFEKVKVEVR